MTAPLWTFDDAVAATGATREDAPGGVAVHAIDGVSIDSRSVAAGDLFVALTDQRDGHEFVEAAFVAGAAAALVRDDYARRPGDGMLLRVGDPLTALEALGRAARARTQARIVAVTGSAGKTGTKEMLRAMLSANGATHASDKSYNNHWGVPLTLARMPAETRYGVFEIGMNHPGEITPLTRMVRPHAAIVLNVLPVHIGQFKDEAAIADAKAEIFSGLEPGSGGGGTALINRDNRHAPRLINEAQAQGASITLFGSDETADVQLRDLTMTPDGSRFTLELGGTAWPIALATPGRHIALNALAALAACDVLGADVGSAAAALGAVQAGAGRGARLLLKAPSSAPSNAATDHATPDAPLLLIDESYNANPASMAAVIHGMALLPRADHPRRIAVMGDMLELGVHARTMHEGLATPLEQAQIDLVFTCGPQMKHLYERLPKARRGAWCADAATLYPALRAALEAGDAVMVKGSLGSRMGPIVEALIKDLREAAPKAKS
ncbi:MAG: UDP-N-acetylmuramoyl-tripeptide--D-alanyl-D-alanine ligase [Pseudomonadota bacterium]